LKNGLEVLVKCVTSGKEALYIILSVGIKYSMRDVIYGVDYCAR